MKIFLDDIRSLSPDSSWIVVRYVDECTEYLKSGEVTHISLDHDLGETDHLRSGYDVAVWMEKKAADGELNRMIMTCHSANPVGKRRIEQVFENIRSFWDKQGI